MDDREHFKLKLESVDEEVRLQGLKDLAPSLGREDFLLPEVLRALGDDSWRVRKEAVDLILTLPEAASLAAGIIELLHDQENAGLRNAAVEILVRLGRPAIPPLIDELSCDDQDVRKFVLDILGEIGERSSVSAMLPSLRDGDSNVQVAAAENLGKLRAAEAVPALLEALEGGELLLRFTVLDALGRIGTPVPGKTLLRFQEEKLLRPALYKCLGRVGGAESGSALLEGLSDRMSNVREAAVLALGELSGRLGGQLEETFSALASRREVESLVELLDSHDPGVRRAAAALAGRSGDERFAFPLLKLLDDQEICRDAGGALLALGRPAIRALLAEWDGVEEAARTFIAYFVGETGCLDGFGRVCAGLTSADPQMRMVCAQALGKLGEGDGIEPLVRLLEDPAEEVRQAAMEALCRLAKNFRSRILQVLSPLLENGGPQVRMNAVAILGSLDDRQAEQALALAAKDESPLVRRAALASLGRQGEGRNLQSLSLGLTDEDAEVRRISAQALGSSGQREAVAPLELALRDEDIWVRTAAVHALARLGGKEAAELATGCIGDPVGVVAIAALETLAELDPEKAFPLVEEALCHEDEEVVKAALKLLADSGRKEWVSGGRDRLLNHPHWEVRSGFAHVLADLEGRRCTPWLEGRLHVEEDPAVRQQIRELLASIGESQG